MFGPDWEVSSGAQVKGIAKKLTCQNTIYEDLEMGQVHTGIIPNTVFSILKLVENEKKQRIFNIYCSFLQIYNEKIYDLLNV